MNDLRGVLAAARAASASLSTALCNDSLRGLEGHAICHVQTSNIKPTDLKPGKPPVERPPEGRPLGRLSVSVAESENATCELCHLGHKNQHGKDLGKVLTFSSGQTGETAASCVELHHLCMTLSLRGDKTVSTIEEVNDALEEAKSRRCHACNTTGAFIQCCYGECPRWYHLGCAMNATDVVVDVSVGQLYCPKHTVPDSDDSSGPDAIFRASPKKQRQNSGSKASLGPKKKPLAVQRPRTDWQRRGATWVKVVPPWWAEQKTVHFANKVFRELFRSNLEVDLLDEHGTLWKCEVMKEMRNDMRLQFTLMGQFQELWVHAGIMPGDVLTFEKMDPESSPDASITGTEAPHLIRMIRHAHGVGFEDLMAPKAKKARVSPEASAKSTDVLTSRPGAGHGQPTRSAKSRYASRATQTAHVSPGKIVTQETPWFFASEHIARKVMHPNNVAKTRCPMTDELAAKIAGAGAAVPSSAAQKIEDTGSGAAVGTLVDAKLGVTNTPTDTPTDTPAPANPAGLGPTFAVFDPALQRHFVFETKINEQSTARFITGGGFLAWMVEAAVKPEDSIQLEFLGGSAGGQTILVSKIPYSGTPHDPKALSRAPSSDCSSNTSMKTLAAAACYCHTHGTPGIKALLDLPSSDREI